MVSSRLVELKNGAGWEYGIGKEHPSHIIEEVLALMLGGEAVYFDMLYNLNMLQTFLHLKNTKVISGDLLGIVYRLKLARETK